MNRLRHVLRSLLVDPIGLARRASVRARLGRLRIRNSIGRRRVTGSAPAVVNLTSFGHRMASVYLTLESIGRGRVRPKRLILWVDRATATAPPAELRRLVRRGLELLETEDYGPHKKQYPYAIAAGSERLPLVAADDDVVYDPDWLEGLLDAYARHPQAMSGYRAHEIAVDDDGLRPYAEWKPRIGDGESFAAICTGVSGIIYPPSLIDALRSEGEAFRAAAPHADDVWVHSVAVRAGIRSRQVGPQQRDFQGIPGSQKGTLYRRNVVEGGNDRQIAASYSAADIRLISRDVRDGR